MALKDRKITEAGIAQHGVIAAPDRLTGTAAENKKVFDKLVRNVVAEQLNGLIDELVGADGAKEIGASPINGLDGDNVQQLLAEMKAVLDERIEEAGVASFNGRSGIVVPKSGDYTAAMVGAASYEFGYWTPVFPEGSGFILYGSTNARYLKIGRFVYARMTMRLTTTDAAEVRFGGLPYAPVSTSFGAFGVNYNAQSPSVHGGTVMVIDAATCLLTKNWVTYSELRLTPSEVKTGNNIDVCIMYEAVEA